MSNPLGFKESCAGSFCFAMIIWILVMFGIIYAFDRRILRVAKYETLETIVEMWILVIPIGLVLARIINIGDCWEK